MTEKFSDLDKVMLNGLNYFDRRLGELNKDKQEPSIIVAKMMEEVQIEHSLNERKSEKREYIARIKQQLTSATNRSSRISILDGEKARLRIEKIGAVALGEKSEVAYLEDLIKTVIQPLIKNISEYDRIVTSNQQEDNSIPVNSEVTQVNSEIQIETPDIQNVAEVQPIAPPNASGNTPPVAEEEVPNTGIAQINNEVQSKNAEGQNVAEVQLGEIVNAVDNQNSSQLAEQENSRTMNPSTLASRKPHWSPTFTLDLQRPIASALLGENKFGNIERIKLLKCLLGEKEEILFWGGKAKTIITVFYDLHFNNLHYSSKNFIALWLSTHVQFKEDGEVKFLNYWYAKRLLTKANTRLRTRRSDDDYIDIPGIIRKANQK